MLVVLGITTVFGGWFYFDHMIKNKQINLLQVLIKTLIKSIKWFTRTAWCHHWAYDQDLQSQRPVVVRLVDELARHLQCI